MLAESVEVFRAKWKKRAGCSADGKVIYDPLKALLQ